MKWTHTLATFLLLMISETARSQTLDEFLDASERVARSSKEASTDFSDWVTYNRAGWRAINKGYFDTAEHEFFSAIKAAKRPSINDPRLVARSYSDYALAIQKQGRYSEAEPLAKWAMEVRITLLDPSAPAIVQSQNQMGTLYYELGRFAEAEKVLRRAIEAQAKAPKPNVQEHARSQTLLGLLMVAQRRYAEAEPFFQKAIKIREKGQGPSNPETGDALNNLAWTYFEQGKDDLARPLFERAQRIFEQTRGVSHPSVAHVLDGLAQIRSKSDQDGETEANFLRAIEIWDESAPSGNVSQLEVLKHYADWLEKKGRTSDSAKIKARIAPLRGKYTLNDKKAGDWYRFPEAPLGSANPGRGLPG